MKMMLALAAAVLTALPALAQPRPAPDMVDVLTHTPPRVYEGQSVIRVRTTSQAQLDTVLQLAQDVWSERTGVGPLEFSIATADIPALARIGVPHDVLIDDLQAHTDAGWQRVVEQTRIEQREGARFQRGGQVHDEAWFANYRQLAEIQTYIDNIAALRPDLAAVSVIGQSWEGRDMHAITISGPDTPDNPVSERPAVFIFSTVHAREWIAPMTTCYIASRLVSDYDTDPRVAEILDNTRVVIVPVGNPDGYLYTWSNQRLWRNTRRDNGDGTFGVNINRNWGYEWGNQGSSGSPGSTNYRGTHPFSEPETSALRDVALGLGDKLKAHIDYHSYSQLIMWPFGYEDNVISPEPYATIFESVAVDMADAIHQSDAHTYDPIQSVDLYPAAGDSSDWFFGALNCMSYTLELRPEHANFGPPPSTILPCATENYDAFLVLLEEANPPRRVMHIPPSTHDLTDSSPVRLHLLDGFDPVPDQSAQFHIRVSGTSEYTSLQMTQDEAGDYVAYFPATPCGQPVEYYFTIEQGGGTVFLPTDWEIDPFISIANDREFTLYDSFETDTGWTGGGATDSADAGFWERVIPDPDTHLPAFDRSPDGEYCWVTDGRTGTSPDDFDVDGGPVTLTSPRFAATEDSILSFRYWQSTVHERVDAPILLISNDDGLSWRPSGLLPRPPVNQWARHEVRISDHVVPTDEMRVRFSAVDRRDDHTVELAIDDVTVGVPGCPDNPADINADGVLNFFDVSAFIQEYNAQTSVGDFNNDGAWTFFDVSAFLTAFTGGV